MATQDLPSNAQDAANVLRALSPAELAGFGEIPGADLAIRIADTVQTATPGQLADASSKLSEGVQAARAHGFKQGTAGIEVKITRPNGEEVTCLLSEGARGKWLQQLPGYGKEKLNGASLLPWDDFEAVVKSLYNAIQDMSVRAGALQTDDAVLGQAYQIVTQGVRTYGGFSQVFFEPDGKGPGAGRRCSFLHLNWDASNHIYLCALFRASPAELNPISAPD